MSGDDDPMSRQPSIRRALAPLLIALAGMAGASCREGPGPAVHEVPGGDPARGRQLIVAYGCGACHHAPGVPGAVGAVGPSFDGFGTRAFIVGRLRNEPAGVIRWIRTPQAVRPGTLMPDLGVSEADAHDLAAYLYTQQPGGLGPPHLLPSTMLPEH